MEEEDSRKREQQSRRSKGGHMAGLFKKLNEQCVQRRKSEGACSGSVGTEAIYIDRGLLEAMSAS